MIFPKEFWQGWHSSNYADEEYAAQIIKDWDDKARELSLKTGIPILTEIDNTNSLIDSIEFIVYLGSETIQCANLIELRKLLKLKAFI